MNSPPFFVPATPLKAEDSSMLCHSTCLCVLLSFWWWDFPDPNESAGIAIHKFDALQGLVRAF